MTYWIYPWNEKLFDLYGCLREFGFIEWRQKNKVSKGDRVIIYAYGPIGKKFIEVHHLEFLSKSNGNPRKTDIATQLIPVCSNCHSMLHRKIDGHYPTPDELKHSISKH